MSRLANYDYYMTAWHSLQLLACLLWTDLDHMPVCLLAEDPSSSSDSDAELIDRGSLQSDGILPDPQSRLATQASLKQLLRPTSLHSSPTPARNAMARPLLQGSASKRVANNPLVKVRGHTASSLPSVPGSETGDEVLMGTSYMSYASGVTSHGDAGPSPFGASPYDASMLVSNPLGTSPGAAPMSLGTPLEGHYMHQVPVRLAAAARR